MSQLSKLAFRIGLVSVGCVSVTLGGEVPGNLGHGHRVWVRRDPGDVDGSRRMLDHEQVVVRHESAAGPGFGREEVGCGNHVGVSTQEGAPGCGAVRSRCDAVLLQRLGDCGPGYAVVELLSSPWIRL